MGNGRVYCYHNAALNQAKTIQEVHYYPFGLPIQELSPNFEAPLGVEANNYQYNGIELVEDFGLHINHAQFRSLNPQTGRWWQIDPMAEKFYVWSGYNYVLGNPVRLVDLDGKGPSPCFDKEGCYLGTDDEGFRGEILIFDDSSKFKEGMKHNEATKIARIFKSAINLSQDIMENIFHSVITGTIFPDGTKLKSSDFIATLGDLPTANATYAGFKNGVHHVRLSISDFAWTVENIRSEIIHEIDGHGRKGYGDDTKDHYKAYFSQIDSKYWEGTTESHKEHVVNVMWSYYYYEVGNKPLPLKYHSEYLKYFKK